MFTMSKPVGITRKSPNKKFDNSSTMDYLAILCNFEIMNQNGQIVNCFYNWNKSWKFLASASFETIRLTKQIYQLIIAKTEGKI